MVLTRRSKFDQTKSSAWTHWSDRASLDEKSCKEVALKAKEGAQHTAKQRSCALFTGKGSHAKCHSAHKSKTKHYTERSCSKSANTRFYTKGEPAWANYVLMPKILLHFLTVDKKLWLDCNNLFLPSLAMLNQGSCQKYPLDMKAVTYLKTMHPIFKCTSVLQFCSSSVFLQCPVSVTFHNLLAHTFQIKSSTDMCF